MLIQKMDNQARGITYYNGKIVFVNNALPKEDVDISIVLDKKRYSVANVSKYNTLAPNRISPKCKYYDICGGCQLEHISYQDELEYKKNYLNDIFRELNIKIDKIVNCNDYGYRNKITLKVNNNKIGYNKLNSGEIININKCLIANKLINEKIKYLGYIDKNTVTDVIIKSFNNTIEYSEKPKIAEINSSFEISNIKATSPSNFSSSDEKSILGFFSYTKLWKLK